MSDLTLKKVRNIADKIAKPYRVAYFAAEDRTLSLLNRAAEEGFIAGMRAAAEIKDMVRDVPSYSNSSKAIDWGHDRHQSAIRAAIRRLKRSIKEAENAAD
jgi:hypothetical protein